MYDAATLYMNVVISFLSCILATTILVLSYSEGCRVSMKSFWRHAAALFFLIGFGDWFNVLPIMFEEHRGVFGVCHVVCDVLVAGYIVTGLCVLHRNIHRIYCVPTEHDINWMADQIATPYMRGSSVPMQNKLAEINVGLDRLGRIANTLEHDQNAGSS